MRHASRILVAAAALAAAALAAGPAQAAIGLVDPAQQIRLEIAQEAARAAITPATEAAWSITTQVVECGSASLVTVGVETEDGVTSLARVLVSADGEVSEHGGSCGGERHRGHWLPLGPARSQAQPV